MLMAEDFRSFRNMESQIKIRTMESWRELH